MISEGFLELSQSLAEVLGRWSVFREDHKQINCGLYLIVAVIAVLINRSALLLAVSVYAGVSVCRSILSHYTTADEIIL